MQAFGRGREKGLQRVTRLKEDTLAFAAGFDWALSCILSSSDSCIDTLLAAFLLHALDEGLEVPVARDPRLQPSSTPERQEKLW